jgi:hypothetical protein
MAGVADEPTGGADEEEDRQLFAAQPHRAREYRRSGSLAAPWR